MMRRPATIALLGLLIASPSGRADEADRLTAEARAFFQAVLAHEEAADQCRYDADWQNDAVPEYIASKYLGVTLHASLASPEHTDDLRVILDPNGRTPAAFCDEAKLTEYEGKRFQAVKDDPSVSSMEITAQTFTFPVFDAGYRTAIVIVTGRRDNWYRADRQEGEIKRGELGRVPPEVARVAKIFRKTSKGWTLVASELIGQT